MSRGFLNVSALGVEEQRVNVILDFADPLGDWKRALGDGYRVELRVVIWEQPDVVRVPTSALFRQGIGSAVFVLDGGHARLRPVVLGQMGGLEAQASRGSPRGERVVVHPGDAVGDGARITPRTSQEAT